MSLTIWPTVVSVLACITVGMLVLGRIPVITTAIFGALVSIPLQAAAWLCIRRAAVRKRAVWLAALVSVVVVCGFQYWEGSPQRFFQQCVLDPTPSSVVILQGRQDYFGQDPAVWLHFRISGEDFDKILASRPVEIVTGEDDLRGSLPPDWWKPTSLKGYTCWQDDKNPQHLIRFWADETRTEVFFAAISF